jgi:endonuclease YncB( thermonuclease family)
LLLAWLPVALAGDCNAPSATESARVVQVVDGDTLVLAGGAKLRLIGVDAPEVGRDGLPDQPLAHAARTELERLLRSSGWRVRLLPGAEPRDRFGRRLDHVYDRDGRSLAEHLLRRGLAYQVAIPPNDRFADCHRDAEEAARAARLGLWASPALDAASAAGGVDGFQRIIGWVQLVRPGRAATSILLEGGLVLRITEADRAAFDDRELRALPGRRVEARGWVYRHRSEARMRLRHPSALRVL